GIRDPLVTGVQTCALPILWLERTPPDFTFDVKAHALMTGQPSEVKRLPKEIREELPIALQDKGRIYGRDLPKELYDAIWDQFLRSEERRGGQESRSQWYTK